MVTLTRDGRVLFELYSPNAHKVALSGSFNGWSRDADLLQPRGDGWWSAYLPIPPGDHTFQYLINDHDWQADFAAHGVELNGYGLWVSQLWVDPKRRTRQLQRVAAGESATRQSPRPTDWATATGIDADSYRTLKFPQQDQPSEKPAPFRRSA